MELAEPLCDVVSVATGGRPSTLHVTISIGVAPIAAGAGRPTPRSPTPTSRSTRRKGRAATARGCSRHGAVPGRRAAGVAVAAGRRRAGRGHDAAGRPADRRPRAPGVAVRHELLIRLRDRLEPPLAPRRLPARGRAHRPGAAARPLGAGARGRRRWPRRARRRRGCGFEVNVSARSLDDPGAGRLDPRAAQGGRGEPERLGLEITETAAISSLDAARLPRPAAVRGGLRLHARRLRRGLRLVLPPQEPAVHRRQDRGGVRAAGRRPTPSTAR